VSLPRDTAFSLQINLLEAHSSVLLSGGDKPVCEKLSKYLFINYFCAGIAVAVVFVVTTGCRAETVKI